MNLLANDEVWCKVNQPADDVGIVDIKEVVTDGAPLSVILDLHSALSEVWGLCGQIVVH